MEDRWGKNYLSSMPSFRSRPSRGISIFTVVVGIGMLIFGISMAGKSGFGGGGPGGGFMALWVLVLIGIIGYHIYNAASGKGYTESIDYDDPIPFQDSRADLSDAAGQDDSVASRLRELDSLKGDGLISDEEYATERQRILGSL